MMRRRNLVAAVVVGLFLGVGVAWAKCSASYYNIDLLSVRVLDGVDEEVAAEELRWSVSGQFYQQDDAPFLRYVYEIPDTAAPSYLDYRLVLERVER